MAATFTGVRVTGTIRLNTGSVPTPTDQYAQYTVLRLPGTGTNNSANNTFIDSSTNNFTVTRFGNTTQGSFSPFSTASGYWSNYFDGSGDYLSISRNNAFLPIANEDFTIEAWVYLTGTPSAQGAGIVGLGEYGLDSDWNINIKSNFEVVFWIQPTATEYKNTIAPVTLNSWNHIAVSRFGTGSNNLKVFVNGVGQSFTTNSTTVGTGGRNLTIGADQNGDEFNLTGYISNLRIVKGTALYTTNFTPSTTPLTAVTNTSLLTCQSNRFVDNSTNNFTVTRNGDTTVSAFGPFAPASTYDSSTMGGSMYFDGTGDYLTLANNDAYSFGSTPFTIEGWFFTTSTATQGIIGNYRLSGINNGWRIVMGVTGIGYGAGTNAATVASFSGTLTNSWRHFAVVGNGTTVRMYVDGVQGGTSGAQSASVSSNFTLSIGKNSDDSSGVTWTFNGYISNLRIVKGTAVYTANFTPPTAPVSAITGTSLLLNGTNGAIVDQSTKNNLETLGDAKVSTTISANGSMFFDGTGDYLTMPASVNLAFGTGDFTAEFWIYKSASGTAAILDCTGVGGFGINIQNTTIVPFASNSTGYSVTGTVPLNTWTHVAVSRQGSSLRTFMNGVLLSTQTVTYNFTSPGPLNIGRNPTANSQYLNGYINDLRLTKGIARYTANFTPPTRS